MATVMIGLEVHVRLATRTKLFCACSAQYGAPPNSQTCPVCLGLPGSLPVLNADAVRQALVLAAACGATVTPNSRFDRKQYVYPDLPRNYQITQQEQPLLTGGRIEYGSILAPGFAELQRLHLEEDAGRCLHDTDGRTRLDFNRAGTPLLEIVTAPIFSNGHDAYLFLRALRRLLRWLDVSDANMEQGSLRCDANISLVRPGEQNPGPRVEIKNLNTARGVERALVWEQSRQQDLLEQGKTIACETRGWDAVAGITTPLRAKESSAEYRFLDEPDLPPISLVDDALGLAARGLPELPTLRARRLVRNSGLAEDQAEYLTSDRKLADLYERTARLVDDFPVVARWFCGPLAALSRQRPQAEVAPVRLAQLIRMQSSGKVTQTQAQALLNLMVDDPRGVLEIAMEQNLTITEDRGEILQAVTALMAEFPDQVQAYREGKITLIGWFIGQVSTRLEGRADPKAIRSVLKAALEQTD